MNEPDWRLHAVRALTMTDREGVEMAEQNGTPRIYGFVYMVEHRESGMVYVGQTVGSIETRWIHHSRPGNKSRGLGAAIREHGKASFDVVELDIAKTKEHLDSLEVFYIDLFKSQDRSRGYNRVAGGSSWPMPEEARALISKANKGKKKSPEHLAKIAAALTGKKASPEARAKMSAARKALWADPGKRAGMQQASTQGKQTEAHRRAVSDAVKRQRSAPVFEAKLAAAIAATKAQGDLVRAAVWKDPVKRAARIAKMNETRDRNKALRALQQ